LCPIFGFICYEWKFLFQKSKTCPAAAAMSSDVIWDVLGGLNKVAGMVVMLVLSYKWSNYLATLHDNHFWFGNIQVSLTES
jgi:hypothetical protein